MIAEGVAYVVLAIVVVSIWAGVRSSSHDPVSPDFTLASRER
jgi:hypothetical protein